MKYLLLFTTVVFFAPFVSANCEAVKIGDVKFSFYNKGYDTEIRAVRGKKLLSRQELPVMGMAPKCKKLQAFAEQKVILMEFDRGGAGTKMMVGFEDLLVYMWEDGKLKSIMDPVTLRKNVDEGSGVKTEVIATYSTSTEGGKMTLKWQGQGEDKPNTKEF